MEISTKSWTQYSEISSELCSKEIGKGKQKIVLCIFYYKNLINSLINALGLGD